MAEKDKAKPLIKIAGKRGRPKKADPEKLFIEEQKKTDLPLQEAPFREPTKEDRVNIRAPAPPVLPDQVEQQINQVQEVQAVKRKRKEQSEDWDWGTTIHPLTSLVDRLEKAANRYDRLAEIMQQSAMTEIPRTARFEDPISYPTEAQYGSQPVPPPPAQNQYEMQYQRQQAQRDHQLARPQAPQELMPPNPAAQRRGYAELPSFQSMRPAQHTRGSSGSGPWPELPEYGTFVAFSN